MSIHDLDSTILPADDSEDDLASAQGALMNIQRSLARRKETKHVSIFQSEPRESSGDEIVRRTLAQAQALEQGGIPGQHALALRRFGEYVAGRRRSRGLTRASATENGHLAERQLALAEWGLYQIDELQDLLSGIAKICGVSQSDLQQTLRSFLESTSP